MATGRLPASTCAVSSAGAPATLLILTRTDLAGVTIFLAAVLFVTVTVLFGSPGVVILHAGGFGSSGHTVLLVLAATVPQADCGKRHATGCDGARSLAGRIFTG